MENVIGHYLSLLEEDTNPGLLLTKFYCEIFELPFSVTHIKMFNRLVKLYGRKTVFSSIVEISSNSDLNHTNIVGLLTYVCKKQLEKREVVPPNSLVDLVKQRLDKINGVKLPINIGSPFDDK